MSTNTKGARRELDRVFGDKGKRNGRATGRFTAPAHPRRSLVNTATRTPPVRVTIPLPPHYFNRSCVVLRRYGTTNCEHTRFVAVPAVPVYAGTTRLITTIMSDKTAVRIVVGLDNFCQLVVKSVTVPTGDRRRSRQEMKNLLRKLLSFFELDVIHMRIVRHLVAVYGLSRYNITMSLLFRCALNTLSVRDCIGSPGSTRNLVGAVGPNMHPLLGKLTGSNGTISKTTFTRALQPFVDAGLMTKQRVVSNKIVYVLTLAGRKKLLRDMTCVFDSTWQPGMVRGLGYKEPVVIGAPVLMKELGSSDVMQMCGKKMPFGK
jgi:hypothetical protein